MVITFEAQLDPVVFIQTEEKGSTWETNPDRVFTPEELQQMEVIFRRFVAELDQFNEYIRTGMYVDQDRYYTP